MSVCGSCCGKNFIHEDYRLICSDCGRTKQYNNLVDEYRDYNGVTGTSIHIGTTGAGNHYSYEQTKIYKANKLIEDVSDRLGLSTSEADAVKAMARDVTDGEYGQGNWFDVLIGACAYVTMRKVNKALPMAEVASAIGLGSDSYELGRMIIRVAKHLNLKKPEFPEFDIIHLFERTLRNSSSFERLERDKVERIKKQGLFLMHCAVKWFLTTGRRPLPVVVAVLVLVGELNGVVVKVEDLAKEIHAVAHTCRLRYKELLEALVKVAQVLPWGKDVTVKNVVKNAPFVIQYMERKSMSKPSDKKSSEGGVGFDLGDVVNECLRKDIGSDIGFFEETEMDRLKLSHDSRYFEVQEAGCTLGVDNVGKMKFSHECLSMVYSKFLDQVKNFKSKGFGGGRGRKRNPGFELHDCTEWWNGKSELSKRLLLKDILEKDVGLDAMPPSFVKGCVANKRRREKINAANLRIDKVMHPSNAQSDDISDICISEDLHTSKKRKRAHGIDWEDLIIETLLLHGVKEEEIEKGWYNALLDLHVFNSGVV